MGDLMISFAITAGSDNG